MSNESPDLSTLDRATLARMVSELQEERNAAMRLLNPACADETLEGAIRNLQQAYVTECGNAETGELVVRELQGELHQIDQALARRPALDDCKTRAEKVWRACDTAAALDRQLADARGYEIRFKALEPKLKDCESALANTIAERDDLIELHQAGERRLTAQLAASQVEVARMSDACAYAEQEADRQQEAFQRSLYAYVDAKREVERLRAALTQVGERVRAKAIEIAIRTLKSGRDHTAVERAVSDINIAAIVAASAETVSENAKLGEHHPLAHLFGKYDDDPLWKDFEAARKASPDVVEATAEGQEGDDGKG